MNAKQLTEQNYVQSVTDGVALIDFWAPWCGPCQIQLPIMEKVAERLGDRALVGKVNVDENPGVAASYGVRSIPTLILLKDGQEVGRFVGIQPDGILVDAVEEALTS